MAEKNVIQMQAIYLKRSSLQPVTFLGWKKKGSVLTTAIESIVIMFVC